MTKFHYPLRVQAEMDDEPIYIVDQDDIEVAVLHRSEQPVDDIRIAQQLARTIESIIVGHMVIDF